MLLYYSIILTISVKVRPKGKIVEEELTTVEPKHKRPVFADQLELIRNIRSHPEIGFYYMIYAVDRSSEFFNPYALT